MWCPFMSGHVSVRHEGQAIVPDFVKEVCDDTCGLFDSQEGHCALVSIGCAMKGLDETIRHFPYDRTFQDLIKVVRCLK